MTLWFRNVASLLSDGDTQRHLAALHHHRHAAGPEQRGRPVLGARQRAHGRQPPAHEPVPEHGVARPAEGVRGGQRALRGGPDGARQPARARSQADDRRQDVAVRRRRRREAAQPARGRPDRARRRARDRRYLGFTKDIPFTHGFELNAVFQSANIAPPELAGADRRRQRRQGQAGRARTRTPNAAVVTMEINEHGLPIHEDATAKIRPRIFLEGNFFVDLQPGHAGGAGARRGDTIKITQTATPVQLDQVLTALQSDTREDLRTSSTSSAPRSTRSRRRRRTTRRGPVGARADGRRGAERRATSTPAGALKGSAIVNQALPRHRARPRPVAADRRAPAQTTGGARRATRQQLKDLITNFNTHHGGVRLASGQPPGDRSACWRRRWRPPTARSPRSTPRSRRRARSRARSCPGVRETPATIDAVVPVDRPDGRARLARPSSAGPRARPAPGRRRPRRAHRRHVELLPADRPRRAARRRDPADRRRVDHTTVRRPARRTTRSSLDAGRPRRRGPELRRQRPVRALPDRRRHADALARAGRRVAGHRCSATRRRRRSAPGRPTRASARRTSPTCPATSRRAAEPQRPGGREVRPDAAAGRRWRRRARRAEAGDGRSRCPSGSTRQRIAP